MEDIQNKVLKGGLGALQPELTSGVASQVGNYYGLDEAAVKQLSVLLNSGYSDEEVGKWISDVIGARRDEQKNSLTSQIAEMRRNGVNPDLTGLSESGSGAASSPAFQPLPSEGGNGSVGSRFRPIFSDMIKLATFGVSAYTGFSSMLMQQGLQLAGYAAEDVLSVLGDENGEIKDVNSFISSAIASRGLRGNKARQYASLLGSRVNAMPSIIARLENRSKHDSALFDSRLNSYKSSDEFVNKSLQILKDQQDIEAVAAQADLLERQMKLKFLQENPDYTEETLNAELAQKKSVARKAEADAVNAEKQGTLLGKQITAQGLENQGLETENAVKESDSKVKILQNDLRTIELNAIDEMLKYVESYESADTYYSEHGARYEFRHHQWDTISKYGPNKDLTHYNGERFSRTRYKDYKKRINEYYRKYPSKSNGKLNLKAGPVSAGVSF